MDKAEFGFKTGQLAASMTLLRHADQCEAENIMNSAPCDCGLKDTQALSVEITTEIMERLSE
jgi:hypothetical protein